MDARTPRAQLPALPALAAATDRSRKDAAARLAAARASRPWQRRSPCRTGRPSAVGLPGLLSPSHALWAEEPAGQERRDLTREEDHAFWAWAVIEVLRHTGIRVEELTELSHHSLVQYRLPATGELVPLLAIAPSKTDAERLLVISPELADVLSAIITRIRRPLTARRPAGRRLRHPRAHLEPADAAAVPAARSATEDQPDVAIGGIRDLLTRQRSPPKCITGTDGKPLMFKPHDFRRIFTTDAILNGMPPHIAQLILGHRDINTTMGYKAVYPEEAINGHRAFIARRRQLRPSEEYRTPTDAEWDEFLGHFERRRVALGDCGRAYSTSCIHEHSCIRCPLLRIDPAQRHRLEEIRGDNLLARITEAQREGWSFYEGLEGLRVRPRRRQQQARPGRPLIRRPPHRGRQPRHPRLPRHQRHHPHPRRTP